MSGVTAATVVGGIGSALIGSSAAKGAAEAQERAAAEDRALRREMFNRQIELQEPFRQGGLTAQNRLMTLLGLNPNAGQPAISGGGVRTYNTPFGTFTVPGMGGGAPATNAQGIVVDPKSPDFGKYARDFGMQDFNQDPGYAFRLSEGQKAIERSAAARGGLQSGSALKAAARYGQEMGSQEYQNAFNRYQVNRGNQLNPLQSLMGAGQSAANTLTNAAGQTAEAQGQSIYNAGNARASGQVGSANAWGNAFSNIASSVGSALARNSTYGNITRYGSLNSILNTSPIAAPYTGPIDAGPVFDFGG
jgi:hypothetical protein